MIVCIHIYIYNPKHVYRFIALNMINFGEKLISDARNASKSCLFRSNKEITLSLLTIKTRINDIMILKFRLLNHLVSLL